MIGIGAEKSMEFSRNICLNCILNLIIGKNFLSVSITFSASALIVAIVSISTILYNNSNAKYFSSFILYLQKRL